MDSLLFLQIIAPLAFIYAIRQRMWQVDTIGFIVILCILCFLVLYKFIENWIDFHMTILNLLIVFIVIYHHTHRIRYYCNNREG